MRKKQPHIPSGKNLQGDLTLVQIAAKFSTEEAARTYFEKLRWPNGPVCAHCGNADRARIYTVTPNPEKKIRAGQYKCAECTRSFTVTVGTVCEDSHIPLNKWLIAFYMMCASKTQVSALQLMRQLEIGSYRSALFMCHRIRFALMDVLPAAQIGGKGKTVEADETYIGGVRKGGRYINDKMAVLTVVERGGKARSRLRDGRMTGKAVARYLTESVSTDSHLQTDESHLYSKIGKLFATHKTVNHGEEEYGRYEDGMLVTTNTVEGFFGNTKRSLDGTHHQVSRKHLPLYLAEVDYKYNTREMTDGARTTLAVPKIVGKRLMLRRPVGRV
jgi:transposase-like protein